MKSFVPAKRQQGFSLVELLLVLGVIALIAIAAFIIYPQVQAGTQANTEDTNTTTIAANVKSLFGNSGSYSSLSAGSDSTDGQAKAIFPSSMLATATVQNMWGGNVTLGPDGTKTKFVLTYNGVPDAACVKYVAGVAASFDTVTVDTTNIVKDVTDSSKPQQPDPAVIATACGNSIAAGHVVVFTGR